MQMSIRIIRPTETNYNGVLQTRKYFYFFSTRLKYGFFL